MKKISVAAVLALLACWAPAFASSLSYPLFDDPLHSRPPVLDKGFVLPGDKAQVSCPAPMDFSRPLALGEAVDIALCNNPQIKSSWANIKVQAGALGEAKAAYLPTASGALNQTKDRIDYLGNNTNLPSTNVDRTTFQAGLVWRIFDFGGRAANYKASESLLSAALASHNATLQRALTGVTQAYFDAMSAKAALKASMESEEIAQATLTSATVREEKGAISRSDRLRATTALANAVLENNRANGDYRKALAVLVQILGVPGNTEILMPEDLSADTDGINEDLNSWLEEAQKSHPAIVAARAQVVAAKDQVAAVRSAGLPTFNFAGNFYYNTRPGEAVTQVQAREVTVGVGMTIPFFDGFLNTYKVRGAEAQLEQRKAELADTEHRVALDLVRAYFDATFALKNLGASANLLKAAQDALAVSQRRYDRGAADITELLSTQSNLSYAQRERIRCLAEWHSARLRLLASAGQMGRTAAVQDAEGSDESVSTR